MLAVVVALQLVKKKRTGGAGSLRKLGLHRGQRSCGGIVSIIVCSDAFPFIGIVVVIVA